MLSTKWVDQFDRAAAAYTKAVFWANQEAEQREAAAVAFQDLVSEFRTGGTQALEVLNIALKNSDVIKRSTGARVLVELSTPEALAILLAELDRHEDPPLEHSVLRRLNRHLFFSGELWRIHSRLNLPEQLALLDSLLRDATEAGLEFAEQTIAEDPSSVIMEPLVKALARWGRRDLLWGIVNKPPLVHPEYPDWLQEDRRLDAALHLGLAGDQNAVQFLETIAYDPDRIQAGQAVRRLAWLACPRAIAPITALLEGTDVYGMELALNAASMLSCAAFGPMLLKLASRFVPSSPAFDGPPVSDEAIRVLEKLTGQPLPDQIVEYIVGVIPDTFTESARLQAVSYYHEAVQKLNPDWRYHHGELLTLAHLVGNLVSPHDGPRRSAAYNLQAITGEDHGFDPDLDLIANLPAIKKWRERAKNPSPLKPGGWAFAGRSLPDPEA